MDTLKGTLSLLRSLETDQLRNAPGGCDIDVHDGDWGGQLMTVSLSSAMAIIVARQLIELVERDNDGAHFDIDRASIAPGSKHQLCFSLNNSGTVRHA